MATKGATTTTITHNWQTIALLDADGDAIPGGNNPTRVKALAEYRATGGMTGVFFAYPERRQEDREAWEWGPTADAIDWTGFPTS
jgi:hypothetical protein